jgi:outer membrane receptor for ferrienterochelin and colicin
LSPGLALSFGVGTIMFEAAFRLPFLRKLAASTIATSNLLSQAALSETAENPVTLPPLVVTATRTERSLADQPDSVTVVTRQQIQETPAQSCCGRYHRWTCR